MRMKKKIACALALAVAVAGAGCSGDKKGQEKKEPAKTEATAAKPAEKPAEAKPAEAKPAEAKPAEGEAKPAEGGVEGVATFSAIGQSVMGVKVGGQSLDGVAQFGFGASPGGDSAGCEQYARDLSPFVTELQNEYRMLQQDINGPRAVDALARFGQFLQRSASSLKGIRVQGDRLAAAHAELVAGLQDMGDGFAAAASAARANDSNGMQRAMDQAQRGAAAFQNAFGKLGQICG